MKETLLRSAGMLPPRFRTPGVSPGVLIAAILAILAIVTGAAWVGYSIARTQAIARAHASAKQGAAFEAARLDGQLARFGFLPSLLETSDTALQLLERPDEDSLRHAVSLYLKSINALAQADNLYILSI